MQDGSLLAAIDLGSNSFRLEIGRLEHGQVRSVTSLRETVRQGNGLDEAGKLSTEAMERGWACLARFAEHLAGFGPDQVRAVATQTLREARNREAFLAQAEAILGCPIEVITGQEEARLIYRGVAHLLPDSAERRLVVDIGGRSTELILGRRDQALTMESHPVGSVAWSQRFFPDGGFSPAAFELAQQAAGQVLAPARATCAARWDIAYGASGTVGAVADALVASGHAPGWITREHLDWLRSRLLQARHADALRLPGLREDRKPVIGGGLAVVRAVFDVFGIERLVPAQGALRHGLLLEVAAGRASSVAADRG